ncbi:tyrosine-type recombinase/integrase [Microvirga massiliensis]|uniref:tyrosine-type recombinase/integrase n=1 Tax=Microvirga massiliensis TaxID=1033741 RepID=UPI00062BDB0C|nr:tyrosine-type recombinase/integrase [Microvirga massiliensis]
MQDNAVDHPRRTTAPWNRCKLIGPKPPLKTREIWSIRVRLQVAQRVRDLALFNLALDSKLRACDLVALRVGDVALNGRVRSRATIMQRKTGQPVQFEIAEQTREAVGRWLEKKDLHKGEPLFPSRIDRRRPMTTRQYARLLGFWLHAIGLDPLAYGTHSLRRTKASMIYRRTGNLRAVQLLLGHTKIESTVRYLGIDVDDALLIAEQVEI